ncbi:hypothetical protein SDJN02_13211 [Cucurbita argyrosperma subsp. argyrosperma]|nr:hypothetical protein SDJN02_13211 [Cucurbita argyrosperma subsp. argyrosperma]
MANQQQVDSRPWILDVVPFIVVILIAAHVLACFVSGLLDLQISDGQQASKAESTLKNSLIYLAADKKLSAMLRRDTLNVNFQ